MVALTVISIIGERRFYVALSLGAIEKNRLNIINKSVVMIIT